MYHVTLGKLLELIRLEISVSAWGFLPGGCSKIQGLYILFLHLFYWPIIFSEPCFWGCATSVFLKHQELFHVIGESVRVVLRSCDSGWLVFFHLKFLVIAWEHESPSVQGESGLMFQGVFQDFGGPGPLWWLHSFVLLRVECLQEYIRNISWSRAPSELVQVDLNF